MTDEFYEELNSQKKLRDERFRVNTCFSTTELGDQSETFGLPGTMHARS